MRIEVEYHYPPTLALPPRVEQDGGDIYAPSGTDVQLRVRSDTKIMATAGVNWRPGAVRVHYDLLGGW